MSLRSGGVLRERRWADDTDVARIGDGAVVSLALVLRIEVRHLPSQVGELVAQ